MKFLLVGIILCYVLIEYIIKTRNKKGDDIELNEINSTYSELACLRDSIIDASKIESGCDHCLYNENCLSIDEKAGCDAFIHNLTDKSNLK